MTECQILAERAYDILHRPGHRITICTDMGLNKVRVRVRNWQELPFCSVNYLEVLLLGYAELENTYSSWFTGVDGDNERYLTTNVIWMNLLQYISKEVLEQIRDNFNGGKDIPGKIFSPYAFYSTRLSAILKNVVAFGHVNLPAEEDFQKRLTAEDRKRVFSNSMLYEYSTRSTS